jgi:hypothetical protein
MVLGERWESFTTTPPPPPPPSPMTTWAAVWEKHEDQQHATSHSPWRAPSTTQRPRRLIYDIHPAVAPSSDSTSDSGLYPPAIQPDPNRGDPGLSSPPLPHRVCRYLVAVEPGQLDLSVSSLSRGVVL